ncbi:MAG TPA: alpha/beta hydrolase [Streptosporangiaceae bacterium]|nr:alpha/beta hydrolase [Streptosporangiaceae bacterium]
MTAATGIPGVTHRFVQAGGLRMHIAEAGQGPLVLLLHGFPESWYSWRHQLTALAAAGYHAVAPDQRGYCQTGPPGLPEHPAEVGDYTILHLTGDVIALMDALGEQHAVVAGHDWGAPVAWHAGLFRPDRIRGVIALSVPYRPRGSTPPIATLRSQFGESFYMVYFQRPGVADAELSRDPVATFRTILYSLSGESPGMSLIPAGGGFLDSGAQPPRLPNWLSEQDIGAYVAQYAQAGFTGPLNWYRNLDRNWELTGAWQHAPVLVPALFMAGERDPVIGFSRLDGLADVVPRLTDSIILPGCGHWTQQERPAEVNAAMTRFLNDLG